MCPCLDLVLFMLYLCKIFFIFIFIFIMINQVVSWVKICVLLCLVLGGAPTSICYSFHSSINLSICMSACLEPYISQESYIVWSSFMVHICKMIISPGIFFIFSKFWFSDCQGVKVQKMAKNSCLLHLIFQKPYVIWSSFMMHMFKRIISSGAFFFVFKILSF